MTTKVMPMSTTTIDTGNEHRELARASESHALIAALERAAKDPSVDISKMERLFAMRKEIVLEAAEAAFNQAMSSAQQEMRPIATDASNPQTHSKYASYAQLDKSLRAIYTKHGFAISYDEADSPKAEHIRVLAYVSHGGGFTRTYRIDMPADGKGAKGGDVMTKTHAVGAASSYGMRYLLKRIFNVAVGEDDRDGNEEPTITEKQAADLGALITEGGGDISKALRFLRVECLADIPAKNFDTVVAQIKAINAAREHARRGAR